MKCIVTAGPTYEELDQVRRLTNFSTGTLGTGLADYLAGLGHEVELLIGYYSTCPPAARAQRRQTFTTTADLRRRLAALASPDVGAVFHAAAVSDFTFGKIWERAPSGELRQIKSAKIPTRGEDDAPLEKQPAAPAENSPKKPAPAKDLLAELKPAPKIIPELRGWFPRAFLVGWKYELERQNKPAVREWFLGLRQMEENQTDACVLNGPGYFNEGFGLLHKDLTLTRCMDKAALFAALEAAMESRR
jgi:phosphopantothenoylcysteine decarboxylase/phosphopantothenate--cysteine ligase